MCKGDEGGCKGEEGGWIKFPSGCAEMLAFDLLVARYTTVCVWQHSAVWQAIALSRAYLVLLALSNPRKICFQRLSLL